MVFVPGKFGTQRIETISVYIGAGIGIGVFATGRKNRCEQGSVLDRFLSRICGHSNFLCDLYIMGYLPQESVSTTGATATLYDILWSADHCIFGHVDSDIGFDVPILSLYAAVGGLSRGLVESFAGWN